jgi:translocator protein
MNQLASPSQLRMSFLRWALFVVPAIMFLGFLSGAVSGSGDENSWFAELIKPDAQPPGWVFGATWTALYLMIAFAFSMILHARGARSRGLAIGLFMAQFLLNLSWSPIFFGRHQVTMAFYLILLILVLAIATTIVFGRIRKAAAWLMVPYLVWLSFASILNFQIDRLNPDAEGLYVPAARSQIGN